MRKHVTTQQRTQVLKELQADLEARYKIVVDAMNEYSRVLVAAAANGGAAAEAQLGALEAINAKVGDAVKKQHEVAVIVAGEAREVLKETPHVAAAQGAGGGGGAAQQAASVATNAAAAATATTQKEVARRMSTQAVTLIGSVVDLAASNALSVARDVALAARASEQAIEASTVLQTNPETLINPTYQTPPFAFNTLPGISPAPVAPSVVHGQIMPLSQAAIDHYQALGVSVSPANAQTVASRNTSTASAPSTQARSAASSASAPSSVSAARVATASASVSAPSAASVSSVSRGTSRYSRR